MKGKLLSVILATFLLVSLTACDSNQNQSPQSNENINNTDTNSDKVNDNDNSDNDKKDTDKKEDEDTKKPEEEEISVKLYFMDDQAENLVEKDVKIELNKGQALEEAILSKLKEDTNSEEFYNTIPKDIVINSVKVEDKIANIDISSANLNGSSTDETFLIDSIVASLTNLDNIEKVQFLVDGQKVETLMGHIETLEPLSKQDMNKTITKSE